VNPEDSGSAPTASAPRTVVTELPTPTSARMVWVLAPLGLNVRADPSESAGVVASLSQGAQLILVGSQAGWLRVGSKNGQINGWVKDDPELVIHRSVAQHADPGGWSILFPGSWALKAGNPATFTAQPGDPEAASLLAQTADDPSKLLPAPASRGQAVRQEGPLLVYGKTAYLTVYKLEGGGFELSVVVQLKARLAFLFLYRQSPRAEADTALFRQLLASVVVPP